MYSNQISLSEPIHTVVQGEGNTVGQKMILIRVKGCPLKCSGCDSAFTWREEKSIVLTTDKLIKQILELSVKTGIKKILFTGGEPGLYKYQINEIIKKLCDSFTFEIETSGFVNWGYIVAEWPKDKNIFCQFNFSPKIGDLKPSIEYKFNNEDIVYFNRFNYIIKIVTSQENFKNDIQKIKQFEKKYKIPKEKIYIMPKGQERWEIISNSIFILNKIFKIKYNFSPRMHIMIFDNKKMV